MCIHLFNNFLFNYCSLPKEIAKMQFNEVEFRRKIKFAIENLYGMDSMVYPPFKAFEAIVRERILLLEEPVMTCLDLVIEELLKAVRACTRRVSDINYVNNILR